MEYENNKMISFHYSSILDFMGTRESKGNMPKQNLVQWQSVHGDRSGYLKEWFGPTNGSEKEVIEHALLGDHTLYEEYVIPKVQKLNQDLGLKTTPQIVKKVARKRIKGSFGSELDIHSVYQGRLHTAWDRVERVEQDQKHPLVTLWVQINGLGDIPAAKSLWTTAVCIRLSKELENAGKAVRLMVGGIIERAYQDTSKYTTFSIEVKKYNERVSYERLAAMSHLGFYRVFGFQGRLITQHIARSGMGKSLDKLNWEYIPIPIQKEIDQGHTRLILVNRSLNLQQAIQAIQYVNQQVKQEK